MNRKLSLTRCRKKCVEEDLVVPDKHEFMNLFLIVPNIGAMGKMFLFLSIHKVCLFSEKKRIEKNKCSNLLLLVRTANEWSSAIH